LIGVEEDSNMGDAELESYFSFHAFDASTNVNDLFLVGIDASVSADNEEERDLRPHDVEDDEVASFPKFTNWKLVMALMIMMMMFSLNHQHCRYANEIARLEQENARLKQEQEEWHRLKSGCEQEDYEEWTLAHAFSRFLVHAHDTGSKLLSEISHGIQASLRNVNESAEETFNLIIEQTREAVEDGAAFVRSKQE
jgi:hypothetical protein